MEAEDGDGAWVRPTVKISSIGVAVHVWGATFLERP